MRSLGPSKSSARPRHPGVPSQKLQPEPVIVDPQISIAVPRDGVRRNALDLLGHNADIGCVVTSFVAKAVDADPVTQPSQRNDVLFESDIGTVPSTMTTTAAVATATTSTAMTTATTAVATATTMTAATPKTTAAVAAAT